MNTGWALLLVLPLTACVSGQGSVPNLARASIASDAKSYRLQRVGLLPFQGEGIDPQVAQDLQSAFGTAAARHAGFEIVPLSYGSLEEVPSSEPFRRGRIDPRTILSLARRYQLDALLMGSVSERRVYAPQRLGLEVDLLAAETGMPIWSASILLDASDERVRKAVEAWHQHTRGGENSNERVDIYLLSPARFAQFAASQMAELLR